MFYKTNENNFYYKFSLKILQQVYHQSYIPLLVLVLLNP